MGPCHPTETESANLGGAATPEPVLIGAADFGCVTRLQRIVVIINA
jgi:hypothetical protein